MAFSADDLVKVEDAIKCYARGERIVAQTLGESMKQYAVLPFEDLLKFRDQVKAEVNATLTGTSTRPRAFRAAHSKGL